MRLLNILGEGDISALDEACADFFGGLYVEIYHRMRLNVMGLNLETT